MTEDKRLVALEKRVEKLEKYNDIGDEYDKTREKHLGGVIKGFDSAIEKISKFLSQTFTSYKP